MHSAFIITSGVWEDGMRLFASLIRSLNPKGDQSSILAKVSCSTVWQCIFSFTKRVLGVDGFDLVHNQKTIKIIIELNICMFHFAIGLYNHTLKPCFLRHSLWASISFWQFSSPCSTIHSSLACLVSGHAQHGFSFFPPSPSPPPAGICCSGASPVLYEKRT